jgi:hypothetical protein
VAAVDTHGTVLVVVLDVDDVVLLLVVVVLSVVEVLLVDVEVDVVVDTNVLEVVVDSAGPQRASRQSGISLSSTASSVTRHVRDGSAQCEKGR